MLLRDCDIYAEQLAELGHGYPLWEPNVLNGKRCKALGDVGYVQDGHFHTLFNAGSATFDGHELLSLPDGFDEYTETSRTPTVLSSQSVQALRSLGVETNTKVDQEIFEFDIKSNHDRGAAIGVRYETKVINIVNRALFRTYIKSQFASWRTLFAARHHIQADDLVLVTGYDLTDDWSMCAFSSNQKDIELGAGLEITGSPITSGYIRWACSSTGRLMVRNGPDRAVSGRQATPKDPTQCIFLRGYRMKTFLDSRSTALLVSSMLHGQEGMSSDLPEESEDEWEDVGDDNLYDPYADVFDYIRDNSDPPASQALVHDDDLALIYQLGAYLEDVAGITDILDRVRPYIEVDEDGVAFISTDRGCVSPGGNTEAAHKSMVWPAARHESPRRRFTEPATGAFRVDVASIAPTWVQTLASVWSPTTSPPPAPSPPSPVESHEDTRNSSPAVHPVNTHDGVGSPFRKLPSVPLPAQQSEGSLLSTAGSPPKLRLLPSPPPRAPSPLLALSSVDHLTSSSDPPSDLSSQQGDIPHRINSSAISDTPSLSPDARCVSRQPRQSLLLGPRTRSDPTTRSHGAPLSTSEKAQTPNMESTASHYEDSVDRSPLLETWPHDRMSTTPPPVVSLRPQRLLDQSVLNATEHAQCMSDKECSTSSPQTTAGPNPRQEPLIPSESNEPVPKADSQSPPSVQSQALPDNLNLAHSLQFLQSTIPRAASTNLSPIGESDSATPSDARGRSARRQPPPFLRALPSVPSTARTLSIASHPALSAALPASAAFSTGSASPDLLDRMLPPPRSIFGRQQPHAAAAPTRAQSMYITPNARSSSRRLSEVTRAETTQQTFPETPAMFSSAWPTPRPELDVLPTIILEGEADSERLADISRSHSVADERAGLLRRRPSTSSRASLPVRGLSVEHATSRPASLGPPSRLPSQESLRTDEERGRQLVGAHTTQSPTPPETGPAAARPSSASRCSTSEIPVPDAPPRTLGSRPGLRPPALLSIPSSRLSAFPSVSRSASPGRPSFVPPPPYEETPTRDEPVVPELLSVAQQQSATVTAVPPGSAGSASSQSTDGGRRTSRPRPRLLMGPRRPSGPIARAQNDSTSSPTHTPPAFRPPSVAFTAHTLHAAQRALPPHELGALVSRAIQQAANSSSIRLLSLVDLERALPAEMQRLEALRRDLALQYKMHVRKRALALSSLAASGWDPLQTPRLVDELGRVAAALDGVVEALHAAGEQLAHLHRLRDAHTYSALALALRKLNASFVHRSGDALELRARVAQLEAERDTAWAQAERVAEEFDALNDRLMEEIEPGSTRASASRRASRVMLARKTSVRAAKAGFRSPSARRSSTGDHASSSAGPISGAPLADSESIPPAIPPVPPKRARPVPVLSIITSGLSSASSSSSKLSPTKSTRPKRPRGSQTVADALREQYTRSIRSRSISPETSTTSMLPSPSIYSTSEGCQ